MGTLVEIQRLVLFLIAICMIWLGKGLEAIAASILYAATVYEYPKSKGR